LLGDQNRTNAINPWFQGQRVFMRLLTRDFGSEISKRSDVIAACKAAGLT
jgi:methylmalonyl-CoA mutase